MSKNLILVIAIILLWFIVIRKIKVTKLPQKSNQANVDTVAQPTNNTTYTVPRGYTN